MVRGNLHIRDNLNLRDIEGLFGLESVGAAAAPIGPDAGNFVVIDNARLSIDRAQDLADGLGADNIGGSAILRGVPFAGDLDL